MLGRSALGQLGPWENPCGGARWRYLPDGSIEVEGRGVPRYDPPHARFELVRRTWENWRRDFVSAASRHDVPVQWLVGIASVETGPWSEDPREQEEIVSYANAIGVMQVLPSTAEMLGYSADDMYDAGSNIDAAAKLIARLDDRTSGGLPAICGAYNSGKFCCSDPRCSVGCQNAYNVCTHGDYPGAAIAYQNTALAYFDLSAGFSFAAVATAGLFAVGAAGLYVAWGRR